MARTFSQSATTSMMIIAALITAAQVAFAQERVTAARFSLTVDGTEIAVFSELVGITTEVEPVENSGGGRVQGIVQLSRPLGRDDSLAAWHELVILGDVAAARKSVRLVAYNSAGRPVLRYHLENAWPKRLDISKFRAGAGEPLMETVT